MKRCLIICCTMLLLFSAYAYAVSLKEVVITATRAEVQRSNIPASVSIITRKEIRESKAHTVSELLKEVTGMDVTTQGGPGTITNVYLRGAETKHTLVLIDGIRVNSPSTGSFDFADLLLDDVERIEIIKGPMSALYGSDAIGGVIQIFTRKAGKSKALISIERGSYDTLKENITSQIKKKRYNVFLSATRYDTEGLSIAKDGSEKDGYENLSVASRLETAITGDTKLQITGRITESKKELDGFDFLTGRPADDLDYRQQRRWSLVGITISNPISHIWHQRLSFTDSRERLQYLDETTSSNRSDIDLFIDTINWQHNIYSREDKVLTVGYEWQNNRANINSAFGGYGRTAINHAFYAQEYRNLTASTNLLTSIRWDDSTIYENAFTYRFGLTYKPAEDVSWYIQYGTGFKGPTLNDLFWPGSGNPSLKPEKSRSWEIGAEETLGDHTFFSISYYSNIFKNLIEWAPDPSAGGLWRPQNVGRASSKGIETEIRWSPSSGISMSGTYTYDDTEDKETHTYLKRRPLNKYTFKLQLRPSSRESLAIIYFHSGRRLDTGNVTLPAYSRVDLTGSYRIGQKGEIYMRIENLFDKEYEEASGYSTPGFSTYGGIRLTL